MARMTGCRNRQQDTEPDIVSISKDKDMKQKESKVGCCNKENWTKKDQGYAWIVAAASFFAHLLIYGISWSIGVFFVMFLEAFGQSKGVTAWTGSLNTAHLYAIGPVASILTNRFGCRPVVFLGGIIAAVGLFASAFATNIYFLYGTFGILTGCGLGIAYIPAIVIVSFYFEKRRTLAMGVAVSGLGVGLFIYPPLIDTLAETYGWRGCLMIMSAVTLNICVCAMLMKPFQEPKPPVLRETNDEKTKICNLNVFKSLNFMIICVNNFLFCLGISVVYVHLSEYALVQGIGGKESSMLFSVSGISNIIGRFLFAFAGHHPLGNDIFLYATAFIITGIMTLFVPFFTTYPALLAYAVAFGFFSSSFGVLLPGIVCQCIGQNELSSGYGVVLPFEAVGTVLGGPLAGFMYDRLHNYNASFYFAGAVVIVSGAMMYIPYWRERQKSKSQESRKIEDKLEGTTETLISNGHTTHKSAIHKSLEQLSNKASSFKQSISSLHKSEDETELIT